MVFRILVLAFLGSIFIVISEQLPSGFFNDVDGISIAVSSNHACSIEAVIGIEFGGRMFCWGSNIYGALVVPKDDVFVQVAVSESFTCGILIDQTVKCWGSHVYPKEIPGFYAQISAARLHMFKSWYILFNKYSIYRFHGCGIMTNGKLNCWGKQSTVVKLFSTN